MKNFLQNTVDLASARLGGKALKASDEFFAPKENLLKEGRGVFIEGKFTSRGKWMDGWESRRRRTPGHDWCVIRLGLRGVIRAVTVDTNHFLGNFPESCSVEAIDALSKNEGWVPILKRSRLKGGVPNVFRVRTPRAFTHIRLNIFPDGGVARFRVHGEVVPDWKALTRSKKPVDLIAIANGGVALLSSDMFFSHKDNLLMPGRGVNMGDGWETKRRRGPGHDWLIIKLGRPGLIKKAEVDTNHFKGNYPGFCSLEACASPGASLKSLTGKRHPWKTLLPKKKLSAHRRHFLSKEIVSLRAVSHVRFNIYPDGGVSRLRLYGFPTKP